jgi:hypothetical protein
MPILERDDFKRKFLEPAQAGYENPQNRGAQITEDHRYVVKRTLIKNGKRFLKIC